MLRLRLRLRLRVRVRLAKMTAGDEVDGGDEMVVVLVPVTPVVVPVMAVVIVGVVVAGSLLSWTSSPDLVVRWLSTLRSSGLSIKARKLEKPP